MSLFDPRAFLAALALLALTACGFAPVYGPGGAGTQLQNAVMVQAPETRDAFLVTRRVEERLGRAGSAARYALDLSVTSSEQGLAVDSQGNITRYNLLGQAQFALRDTGTGQTVMSGTVDNFTGYSATGSTVATLAAARDAQERLMTILADQIIARLLGSADLT